MPDINDALSHGLHAGNYASAYVSEDFETAKEHCEAEDHNEEFVGAKAPPEVREAWEAAFIIGFFGSYETHEVDSDHTDALIEATNKWGQKIRDLGLVCDERSWDEIENVLPEE